MVVVTRARGLALLTVLGALLVTGCNLLGGQDTQPIEHAAGTDDQASDQVVEGGATASETARAARGRNQTTGPGSTGTATQGGTRPAAGPGSTGTATQGRTQPAAAPGSQAATEPVEDAMAGARAGTTGGQAAQSAPGLAAPSQSPPSQQASSSHSTLSGTDTDDGRAPAGGARAGAGGAAHGVDVALFALGALIAAGGVALGRRGHTRGPTARG